jgi:hypothetical protein
MSVVDRLQALSPEQRALFEKLQRRRAPAPAGAPAPPPVARVSGRSGLGDWPLTFDQERLIWLHEMDPGLVSWNVDAGSRVTGNLDLPALRGALRLLVARHAAWRTVFPRVEGRRVQRVVGWLEPEVARLDLEALPVARRRAEGLRAIYGHTRQPFDLERGPLLRVAVVRLAAREHLFLLTIHHLVTDWITFQVFFRELSILYQALLAGLPASAAERLLPEIPVQFPDFAVWERQWIGGDMLAAEAEIWRRRLDGFPLALDLPADRPRPPVQSQRGGLHHVTAGAERTRRLRAVARAEGATPFMAVLAVLYALVWRLTGRDRVVVGSNAANRPRPEVEAVAGCFLTQVPFAADLGGDPTFRELLARSRRAALDVYSRPGLPFSKLIEAVAGEAVAADRSRNPIVQVLLLILESNPPGAEAALHFEPLVLFDGNSRWDLMFGLYDDHDRGLDGALEYNADIFDAATVAAFLDLFYRLIDAVVADPDLRLSQLPAAPMSAGPAGANAGGR